MLKTLSLFLTIAVAAVAADADPLRAGRGQPDAGPRCLAPERADGCGCRLRIVDLACAPPTHAGGGGVHFFSELHRGAALVLVLGGRELTLPSVGPVDRSVFTRARGDSWRETYEQAGIRVRLSYRPGRSTCPVGREDGCEFLDVEADVEITVKGEPPRFHRAVGTCGC